MSRRTRYGSWARRVEGTLLRVTIIVFALLVVAQFLLTNDDARRLMSYVDRLEGVSLDAALGEPASRTAASDAEGQSPAPGVPALTVRLLGRRSARLAVLLVNGDAMGRFTGAEVTVRVKNGDLVEVDGADYRTELRFTVSAVAGGVVEPILGATVATARDIVSVGRVRIEGP
ncbi:MAG: hypothetical protein ACYC6V_00725 [Bacillota bacterium]